MPAQVSTKTYAKAAPRAHGTAGFGLAIEASAAVAFKAPMCGGASSFLSGKCRLA